MKKKQTIKRTASNSSKHVEDVKRLTAEELRAVTGGEVRAVSDAAQTQVSWGDSYVGTWMSSTYGGDYANWAYNE